jgi:hypothetical protein
MCAILLGMTQRAYRFFTLFFLLALLVLSSAAMRDFLLS